VSSLISSPLGRCRRCSQEIPSGALACPVCHALVHAEELGKLSEEAKNLEASGQSGPARENWLRALALLPPDSRQAEWIRTHAAALQYAVAEPPPAVPKNHWVRRLGPFGPLAVLLLKGKGLLAAVFKLKFLLSFAAFFGFYWAEFGAWFGAGFAALVLVHELGHFFEIKRRGLPADMPVFLPGLGAYVRWQALGVSLETRAMVSLAGPLAGCVASFVCLLVWWETGSALWSALARASAWLNALNLIPVWVLDGGQAANAIDKAGRLWLLTACLGLWLILGESIFFLVAAGAVWRLFTKDLPARPSRAATLYYAGLLVALGAVLRMTPATGFGPR